MVPSGDGPGDVFRRSRLPGLKPETRRTRRKAGGHGEIEDAVAGVHSGNVVGADGTPSRRWESTAGRRSTPSRVVALRAPALPLLHGVEELVVVLGRPQLVEEKLGRLELVHAEEELPEDPN